MMLQVGDVVISQDILTEYFCCDLESCKGACCVEGEAGAPLEEDEILEMEEVLPEIEATLTEEARKVIEQQGVADIDRDGDLVTSIVAGKDCIFATKENGCTLCASEKAFREGRTKWCKPASCSLYPIRAKRFAGGLTGLNYHRWSICEAARRKGRELHLPVYRFLREPLIRRFGEAWYAELETTVQEMRKQRLI